MNDRQTLSIALILAGLSTVLYSYIVFGDYGRRMISWLKRKYQNRN